MNTKDAHATIDGFDMFLVIGIDPFTGYTRMQIRADMTAQAIFVYQIAEALSEHHQIDDDRKRLLKAMMLNIQAGFKLGTPSPSETYQ